MKIVKKTAVFFLALVILAVFLTSCAKSEGLYTWYGKKVNVENILTITLDMGEGEREISVPFSLYRTLFLYYAGKVPDTTFDEDGKERKTTSNEKSAAAKELAEDEIIHFYAVMEAARDAGADVEAINALDYSKRYKEALLSEEDSFDNTDDKKYADELFEEMLSSLGMSEDYFEYSCRKSDMEKALKKAISPNAADFADDCYFRVKQLVFSYDFADAAGERAARESANEALLLLDGGEAFDTVAEKFLNCALVSEVYIDGAGKIVGSSDGSSSSLLEYARALDKGEHSGVIDSGYVGSSCYFTIIERESIELDFICGNENEAVQIYRYPYVGADSYTPHYINYLAVTEAYKLNISAVPTDMKIYSLISVKSVH